MSAIDSPLIQAIPDPDAVRDRLAQISCERALLKTLLKLSKRKEQVRERAPEQTEAIDA